MLREWNRNQASFDILAASYRRERDIGDGEGGLVRYPVTTMTASGFEVPRVAPFLGRTLRVPDEAIGAPPVAVVSHRLWRAMLGSDPAAIGRPLKIAGLDREIVGVMPEGYRFPVSEDIWIPFNTDPELYGGVEPRWMRVFGRLAQGTGIEEAQAELDAIRAGYAATLPDDIDLRDRRTTVVPYVQGETEPGTNVLFVGLFAFVVMVLVIACASVANLLLARATSRTGEIAVRAAMGASRVRLISQMLVEALLLTGAGGVVGIAAATIGLQWFQSFLEVERTPFWVHFGLSPAAVVFAVIASFAAALIAGVALALKATGLALYDVLKDEQGSAASGVRFGVLSGTLTVIEVTLSVAFLAAAGLTAQSLLIAGDLNSELPVDEVLLTQITLADEVSTDDSGELIVPAGSIPASQWASFQEAIRSGVEKLPGVRGVLLATTLPGTQHSQSRVGFEAVEGGDPRTSARAPVARISPEFFEVFDSALLAGRNFGPFDSLESQPVAIVNTSFARRFIGGANPLGRSFRLNAGASESAAVRIVGISPDLRMNPGGKNQAGFYLPFAQSRTNTFTLAARVDGDPLRMSASVRSVIKGIDSRIEMAAFVTHAEEAARMGVVYQIMSLMFAALGGTAIFLAVAGLYAVMAVSVAQRTREVGIRLALGARRAGILGVVLRRGLWQVGIGIGLGAGLGWGLLAMLRLFPTGMASGGVLLLALAATTMLIVGMLACIVPGARALAVHPVEALRHE